MFFRFLLITLATLTSCGDEGFKGTPAANLVDDQNQPVDRQPSGAEAIRRPSCEDYSYNPEEDCNPDIKPEREKDFIFVVDASVSMYRNDPIASNTCGRIIGIQKVIQGLGENGNTRYGIVTFSSQIRYTTSGLYDDYYALKSAIDHKYNIGATRVVCGSTLGSNYEHGFAGARNMFLKYSKKARDQYVVLITDGKPNLTLSAENVADGLKSSGVKIITVLTNGRSDILKERIASYDDNGMPMHYELTNIEELYKAIK